MNTIHLDLDPKTIDTIAGLLRPYVDAWQNIVQQVQLQQQPQPHVGNGIDHEQPMEATQ